MFSGGRSPGRMSLQRHSGLGLDECNEMTDVDVAVEFVLLVLG
jgi:hypothetical protein